MELIRAIFNIPDEQKYLINLQTESEKMIGSLVVIIIVLVIVILIQNFRRKK